MNGIQVSILLGIFYLHTNVTSVKRGGSFVIATFCPQVKYAFFITVGVDQQSTCFTSILEGTDEPLFLQIVH